MVFTTEGLFEVAIESWPEWDLNHQAMSSTHSDKVDILGDTKKFML